MTEIQFATLVWAAATRLCCRLSLLICSGPLMTDSERDQIDTDAEVFMRTCSETIRLFKQDGKLCATFQPARIEIKNNEVVQTKKAL